MDRFDVPRPLVADFADGHIEAVGGMIDAASAILRAAALCALPAETLGQAIAPEMSPDVVIDCALACSARGAEMHAVALLHAARLRLDSESAAIHILCRLLSSRALHLAACWTDIVLPAIVSDTTRKKVVGLTRRESFRQLAAQTHIRSQEDASHACERFTALAKLLRYTDIKLRILRVQTSSTSPRAEPLAEATTSAQWLIPTPPLTVAPDGTPIPNRHFDTRVSSGNFTRFRGATLIGSYPTLYFDDHLVDDWLTRYDAPSEFTPYIEDDRSYYLKLLHYFTADDGAPQAIAVIPTAQRHLPQAILLNGPYQWNYYHWLCEYLTQIPAINALPENYRDWPLLVSRDAFLHPNLVEALRLAMAPCPRRLEIVDQDEALSIGELIVPPRYSWLKPCLQTRAHIDARDRMLSATALHALHDRLALRTMSPATRRFFMVRTSKARITNQDEAIALFIRHGFEVVTPECLSFAEAQRLFAQASIIAGPPGAAFANLLLCPKTTTAIVLMPDIGPEAPYFGAIGGGLGQRVIHLCGPTVDRSDYNSAFACDLALAERLLAQIAPPRSTPPDEHCSPTLTDDKLQPDEETAPLVTIVIPAQQPCWFERALVSALGQTHPRIEVEVVDSSPDTRIRDLCRRYPGVRHLRPDSTEVTSAYRRHLQSTRTPYVMLLRDHDLLEPECVAELLAALQETPGAALAFPRHGLIDSQDTALRPEARRSGPPERTTLAGNALCLALLHGQRPPGTALSAILLDSEAVRAVPLDTPQTLSTHSEHAFAFLFAAAGRPTVFVDARLVSLRVCDRSSHAHARQALLERHAVLEAANAQRAQAALPAKELAEACHAYNRSLLLALPATDDDDTFLDTLFAAETLPEHDEYLACHELAATGRAVQALPRLVACLEAESVHWRVHDLLADLAANAGDTALALAYRERAWQFSGQRGAEHLKYAQQLLDAGQKSQAMAILLRLRKRDPKALSGLDLSEHLEPSDPSPQPPPRADTQARSELAGDTCNSKAVQRFSSPLPDAMPRTAPPPSPVADTRTTLCTAPGVPLVSILIPAYKPRWFERALRSALAQDYQNLEILVFDNCPNEDIRDICARYPLVTYYRNPNMGPQNSLDIASASRGRYVKHLFDDDLLEPDCVSALVEAIERAPGTLLAFGASWTIDENDQRTGLRQEIETPETVHLYDGNALCRAFATTCANMIGEFTSVLMDGHWLREDVLRLRRAEALNRELFGLCDVICFMNAAADRPVAFVNRPLTSFRINSESNSNPERNPAFIEAITDWREIIAEAEARGLLTPDERGIARNSYNLRATGMGQTFAGLCAGIAPTLFAPDELPAHAVVEACLVLIHAGRSDEAAPRLIALAEAQSAHPGVFAMLAELALGSGELAVAARFSERSVSLQAYPLSACAAHLALLEKHGLHEVATAFRADALRRHPEAPDLISPTPKAEPADDRFAPPLPPCPMTAAPSEAGLPAPYQRWQVRRTQGGLQADDYQRRVACLWKRRPLFEIVLVVGTGEKTLLADSIDALAAQYYDGWRLSIFAPFSSPDAEFLAPDSPVRWFALTRPEDPEALATAIDCRLAESRADWISFLACGTRLAPEALLCIGDYLALHPDWRLIYSDEDTLAADGTGEAPQFKPDFNLELLRATDYLGGVFVERAALCAAGGYARCPGGETYDLALRLVDHAGEAAIGHIPEVLQRRPVSARARAQDDAARQALAAHFARRGIDAEILPGLIDGQSRRPVYRHTTRPLVSIIVPTRNRLDLLAPCVESLFANTAYPNWELIIVDNGNPEPATTHYFAELRAAQPQRVRIMAQPGDFDFARLNNHAAELAHGDYLLLLNDDTQCIHDDWLDALLAHAQRPEVGIVGARLLFPDSLKVQHAGVVLGMSGSAGHVFSNLDHDAPAYLGRAQLDQEYSAVTGACLLIRRQLYRELDGLDGATFKISYNDIDLCLKVRQRGLKIIYTPHATLLHHGSASQKGTPLTSEKSAFFQQETAAFLTRWRHWLQADPAWSRHLSLSDTLPTLESEIVPAWNSDFQDRPRILTMPSPSPGAAEYRNLAPLRALHAAGRVHYAATCQPCAGFERAPTPVELARAAPDTLLIHAAVDDLRGRALQQYRRFNPEVLRIFSLDDLITDLPRDNPSAAHLPPALIGERLRLGLAASDRLIVSTQPLLDAYRHWIDDIRLLPNRLSTDLWGGVRARRRHGAKARVGWAGAQQHAGDLRFLLDVVRATHTEVDWIFLGMLPEGTEAYVTEYHPYVTRLAEYPAKLASLDLDLAIAPLEVHPFNEAKSNLRLLEYGYLGWPVICTDILPYQTDDPPVLRLPNDPARWIAAIRERVAERDALARSGDALQAWVHRHYLLESHLDEWYAALTR